MTPIETELAALPKMPREGLAGRWRRLFGAAPPPRISRDLMRRAIAHRL